MVQDSTGNTLWNLLMGFQTMTSQVAANIVNWVNPNNLTTPYTVPDGTIGVGNEVYSGYNPPTQCKSGPLDSLEELLLVEGVTPQMFFGSDLNRNGNPDNDEPPGGVMGDFDRGLVAYLTIYSRELNVDPMGNARIYLNDPNLTTLQTNLEGIGLDSGTANFILLARIYGYTTNATIAATSLAGTSPTSVTGSVPANAPAPQKGGARHRAGGGGATAGGAGGGMAGGGTTGGGGNTGAARLTTPPKPLTTLPPRRRHLLPARFPSRIRALLLSPVPSWP